MYTEKKKQLLLATTLFCDHPKSKWFAATNFCDQDVDYPTTNTPDVLITGSRREIFLAYTPANLAEISRTRIQVGLQYNEFRVKRAS